MQGQAIDRARGSPRAAAAGLTDSDAAIWTRRRIRVLIGATSMRYLRPIRAPPSAREAAQLQGFLRPFECSVPSPVNRGVPGSSPGLATCRPKSRITAGFLVCRCEDARAREFMSPTRVPLDSHDHGKALQTPVATGSDAHSVFATPTRSCPIACPYGMRLVAAPQRRRESAAAPRRVASAATSEPFRRDACVAGPAVGEERERHAVMAETGFAANAGVRPSMPTTIAARPLRQFAGRSRGARNHAGATV